MSFGKTYVGVSAQVTPFIYQFLYFRCFIPTETSSKNLFTLIWQPGLLEISKDLSAELLIIVRLFYIKLAFKILQSYFLRPVGFTCSFKYLTMEFSKMVRASLIWLAFTSLSKNLWDSSVLVKSNVFYLFDRPSKFLVTTP